MAFSRIVLKNEIIISVDEEIIDDKLITQIVKFSNNNAKIGLNMKKVKTINSPAFIKFLLEDKFKLFNLQSEVLAYLALVLKSGFLKSHLNYRDFSENKRELIKRKFLVA